MYLFHLGITSKTLPWLLHSQDLIEQPFPLHHYCVTGFVSNAEDKPQFVTPQFSPQISSSTHTAFIYALPMSNRLPDVCLTTVKPSAQFCGILHSHCAIITHLHQLAVNFKGRKMFHVQKWNQITNFFVRWSFYHHYHCTSTYPTNNFWLTDS